MYIYLIVTKGSCVTLHDSDKVVLTTTDVTKAHSAYVQAVQRNDGEPFALAQFEELMNLGITQHTVNYHTDIATYAIGVKV